MYDDLVNRLHRYSENCVAYKLDADFASAVQEAADAIEELTDRNVGKWIPVTERLPDAEKEVYVTDGEYIARAVLLDEMFPGDKPCWSYSGLGKITHWCTQIPLPEPPEKEK